MDNKTLTAPAGFLVSAVKAGIKQSGNLDLGLIVAEKPCTAAAVFTTNKVVGPAVTVSREHIRKGLAQAVFVNAGNANTCTGKRGLDDAHGICRQIGDLLGIKPEHVLVCSTGIIGHFLPMEKVEAGIVNAGAKLSSTTTAAKNFSRAIMTTDLRPKTSYAQVRLGGKTVRIAGTCKGSGMIAPNMATMLAFMTTDVNIAPALLQKALAEVADQTFNKVSVDTHTSTSDTAIVLASGAAGNRRITAPGADYQKFKQALGQVADDLARQIAADGEGATCAITIRVNGAANPKEARAAVRAIVDSPLVRCAFNGGDPNWGRIVSAVGYSGAKFNEAKLTCKIAGTTVFRNGRPAAFDAKALSRQMKQPRWEVAVDLAVGKAVDFCYTCDLSREYVSINADYHT